MTGTGDSYDFVYVHADIPPGMAIREWRERAKPSALVRGEPAFDETPAEAARHALARGSCGDDSVNVRAHSQRL